MGVAAQCAQRFLEDIDAQLLPRWSKPQDAPATLNTEKVLFGQGNPALEVAIAHSCDGQPKAEDVRRLWKLRHRNRSAPVLLIVLYPAGEVAEAMVCGSSGDPAVTAGVRVDRIERICAAALAEPDQHAALRTLERLLAGAKDQLIPGMVNRGLFATHELREGVPQRGDWLQACQTAGPVLGKTGLPLIQALGYASTRCGSEALLLTHAGTSRALAVLLDDNEVFDRPAARFGPLSPVDYAIKLAEQENLPWVIVLRGTQIRLHPVKPNVGVGFKSPSETYTELDLALLSPEDAGYLHLLFSPQALAPGGTAEQILAASANFAADLGTRLRERIYRDVVPGLAVAVANHMGATAEADLEEAYHRTLVILFRLLFLAYAEDRDLLPYGRNPRYDRHAVKTLAKEFAADPTPEFDPAATSLWEDMLTVWRAVDEGNRGWDVPAYDGGLFSHDPQRNPSGAALAGLRLTDAEFGPALQALLVDTGEDGTYGPVDFRSLSVREFGTIYEGLLESSLSLAPAPLTVDAKGTFVPAKDGDVVEVPAGQVYFHNKSGSRKSTGSYFTKSFAVDHLLDHALEPALADHLAQVRTHLSGGDEAAAADAFFDFRVADLAMGSGHFLVAAIDRIAARLNAFLIERPIAAVNDELNRLGQAARDALGDQAAHVEIEPSALLRRQVARRCIYGLDLNLMAVELARLAVWIHTFVPGLPMSSLDHGLIQGNSLTGIGTIEEVLEVLDPDTGGGTISIFDEAIRTALATARDRLMRVARTSEATKQEVHEAARAYAKAQQEAKDATALFNAAIAVRLGLVTNIATPELAIEAGNSDTVQEQMRELLTVHFPARFPEVFLRERPGFDVLLGNPPWEKVKVEEHQWWALRFPGLRSMTQKAKNAAIKRYKTERPDLLAEYQAEVEAVDKLKTALGTGPFPGLRAGTDTDLSIAFAWRFWHLLRHGGRSGLVLPRGVLGGSAGAQLRQTILSEGAYRDVTMLTNTRQWIFDEVHPQYTIGLVTALKGEEHAGDIVLRGPYFSLEEYTAGMHHTPHTLPATDFTTWSDGAVFPVLPHADSLGVFLTLRSHPRLDAPVGDWRFTPLRELHTTDNKAMFDFDLEHPVGDLPVLTGGSFNLWNPDHDEPYAYATTSEVIPWLQERRKRQIRMANSAFYGMPQSWAADPATLPCRHPRIAFRDVARGTDSRTVIACLVPGDIVLVHPAPYLLRKQGSARDEAYLLGVLSSLILDWYARRYVELHLTIGILNSFPIPRLATDDPLWLRIVELSGRLAAVDARYAGWSAEVGVPVGSVTTSEEKADLVASLDAAVAMAYGLDRDALQHILETFHRGWEYHERLAAVMAHYDRWKATAR